MLARRWHLLEPMRTRIVLILALTCGSVSCDLGTFNHDQVGDGDGDGNGDGDGDGRYHPIGFAAASMHGPELNLQAQDCRNCHGDDLAGDIAAPSCDTCHTPEEPQAWRSDCTFCHGGVDDLTGAPPGELDGNAEDVAFGAHSAHLNSLMMDAMDCTDCHNKPTDMMTTGHVFDDTAGQAEVLFAAGRSPDGTYADARCDNLYCHGNGRQNGSVMANEGAMSCAGCHGTPPGSGEHGEHGGDNCFECHNDTTKNDTTIADIALHIDGQRQIVIDNPGGLTVTRVGNQVRCNGRCHNQGRDHENDLW